MMIAQTSSKQTTSTNFMSRMGFAPVTPLVSLVSAPVEEDDFDREHQAWLKENGLDQPLTDQQVNDIITYEMRCM